jgi:3-phenylpropionate/trans-cinnamate dioxygenase ferredoxin reductase component
VSAGTLVVGANQAGVQVAVSLREGGYHEPITVVGEEPHLPYQRPPLSKAFLSGSADLGTLAFRTAAFYEEQGITVLTGTRVEHLALSGEGPAGSGTATTDTGRELPFDRLALTVGARPRRLQLPGAELDGVCYLRHADDAIRLRTELESAQTVVVIGGGFIGLEAAAVARMRGKAVTVVEAADRLIARAVAPVVSDFYRGAHERRGTVVHLSAAVTALEEGPRGRVGAVVLADGTRLPADVVLVGVGIVPRTELAEQIGASCDGGIVVDRCARTSVPGVVAAGDCTVFPNPMTGEGSVRLESVQNAVSQSKVAAAALLGEDVPYTDVPWFWSDQYDLKLQIAGLNAGHDKLVVRGDRDAERFAALYYRRGNLVACDAVNSPADYLTVRKALAQGATIPAERAEDSATPLKTLITTRAVAA